VTWIVISPPEGMLARRLEMRLIITWVTFAESSHKLSRDTLANLSLGFDSCCFEKLGVCLEDLSYNIFNTCFMGLLDEFL